MKIPRKKKKALKRAILKGIGPAWRMKDVKIFSFRRQSINKPNYKGIKAFCNGISVTGYSLGY